MALIKRHAPAEYLHWQPAEVKIIDGVPVRFSDICVHEFSLTDTDDPEIYAAAPIWEWQQSEAGCWVMEHAVTKPYWIQYHDSSSYYFKFKIIARLSEKDQVFWSLKWGGTNK